MEHRYLKNVSTLKLDAEKCTGCGMCTNVCPHAVFAIEKGKAVILDKVRCMGCGACAMNCAFSALSVRAGVGCAAAVIRGLLTGKEPFCGTEDGACCG